MGFKQWLEQKNSTNINEFIRQRKEGAAKIASKAEEKGGSATLTAWHFKAKLPIYEEFTNKVDAAALERRFNELKTKVTLELTQKEFQELMGELEVIGEVYLQSK